MKWLLVTTSPTPHAPNAKPQNGEWNIGDVFARIGVEQVIREVDPSAEFDLLNMDDHADVMREREFDRCVLAGRPLFWRDCETFPEWTHILGGWPGRDKRKIAAVGVGDCYALPRDDAHLRARLADLKAKVWGTSIRMAFDTDDARLGVCPAAWVLLDRPEKPKRKLCNLMVGGGHYQEMSTTDYNLWRGMVQEVATALQARGFDFIAHTDVEREWAITLNWMGDRIIYADTIEPYLEAYASASHYIGNRMHGAVVLAGRNARAMAIGYDSRLGMVKRAECFARRPSELSLRSVIEFAESGLNGFEERRVRDIRGERAKAVRMLEEFSHG